MRKCIILVVLLLVSMGVGAESTQQLSARIQRLEQQLSSTALLEMLDKNERLQSEIQQLRGAVEEIQHKLDTMEKRQQGLYLDLDKRLLALEGGGVIAPISKENGTGQEAGGLSEKKPAQPAKGAQPVAEQTKPLSGNEESSYRQAFGLLKDGRYKEAISGFEHVLEVYPNGKYAGNAQYWLGESYYVTRDFDAARASFAKVIENHPDSTKVPDAMLKLGFIEYEQSQWKHARKSLKSIIKQYPESVAAGLAQQRLELMKSEGR